MIQLGLIR